MQTSFTEPPNSNHVSICGERVELNLPKTVRYTTLVAAGMPLLPCYELNWGLQMVSELGDYVNIQTGAC